MHVTATREVCEALGGDHFPHLNSPSLRLEKFVRLSEKNQGKRDEHLKKGEIDAVVKSHASHAVPAKPFSPSGSWTLVMKLGGRLIVNQAGGISENAGLCLHRHFGYPYMPGSAVKGCARHAAWYRWFESEDPGEKLKVASKIALTFGFPTGDKGLDDHLRDAGMDRTRAGCVAFLAAVPNGPVKLVTDIVNCHHKDYYAGTKDRATDDEAPNPQFFPAVEAGASFVFTIIPLSSRAQPVEDLHGFSPGEFAMDVLREAVELHGIGAKTAAGYGWFQQDEEDLRARHIAEMEKQREERQLAEEREAEERQRAAERARKAERKAREAKVKAAEAERLAAAESATLEDLSVDADLKAICGRVKLMLKVRECLLEVEKDALQERLVAAFASLGRKDAKKLLNSTGGKGKDLWKDLRKWLGDDRTAQLKKEVGAK